MDWQSAMMDRWLERDVLRAAFAAAFNLDPLRIEVTDDPRTLAGPIPPEPRILPERVRRPGAFPLQLDVFLVGDELGRPVADMAGTLDRARELACRLDAVMLIGAGPLGNLEQLRVAPNGIVDVVDLDADALDEDRFVIVGAHPFTEHAVAAAPMSAG
jgi:hypothetical protein